MISKMWFILKLNKFSISLLFYVAYFRTCGGQKPHSDNYLHLLPGVLHIKDSMSDILQDTWRKVEALEKIRQLNLNYAGYEIGYLTHIIQNKYRKMLDRYHSAVLMGMEPLFLFDLIILLEEIEHGYFQLEHIIRMMSQVERKYNINTPINTIFVEPTQDEEKKAEATKQQNQESGVDRTIDMNEDKYDVENAHTVPQTRYMTTTKATTKKKGFDWKKYYSELQPIEKIKEYYTRYTKRPSHRWWWPMEYGWEIEYAWYF